MIAPHRPRPDASRLRCLDCGREIHKGERRPSGLYWRHVTPEPLCLHDGIEDASDCPRAPHRFRSPVSARNDRCLDCGEYEEDGPHAAIG